MAARVLLVEDDPSIAELIALHLSHEGHSVTCVDTAVGALATTSTQSFDLVVLDLGLPDFDGVTLCRRVRCEGRCQRTPMLVVTARRLEADVVLALESGADAIMHKPFAPAELRWRVNTLLRRWDQKVVESAGALAAGGIDIDLSRRQARVRGVEVRLTRQEFDLLVTFARQPGRVFSRRALAARVWGPDTDTSDRAVDIAISRLRQELVALCGPDLIRTVRGAGYVFEPADLRLSG